MSSILYLYSINYIFHVQPASHIYPLETVTFRWGARGGHSVGKDGVCWASVLLQGFGQQFVKAADHGPGIIVKAGSDHGVVVDLFQQQTRQF